jgi:DNA-binding NtrC family response regulator
MPSKKTNMPDQLSKGESMNKNSNGGQITTGSAAFSAKPGLTADAAWDPEQPQIRHPFQAGQETMNSLEKTAESLAIAYLVANLNFKDIPLKEFMDDLENKTLRACLRLTQGSQRNAASILGLKPTALFEKMRKHGINGKRIKLSERLESARMPDME